MVCSFKENLSSKLNKMRKETRFEPDLDLLALNLGCLFFLKNLAPSVTRYHGQLSSCTISSMVQYQKKTNDPVLRKFSDPQTDRQTDESVFIGRCPTNVESPILKL